MKTAQMVHVPFPSRWNGLAIRTSPRSFRKMTELERYFYETINYVRIRVDRWNYSQGDGTLGDLSDLSDL